MALTYNITNLLEVAVELNKINKSVSDNYTNIGKEIDSICEYNFADSTKEILLEIKKEFEVDRVNFSTFVENIIGAIKGLIEQLKNIEFKGDGKLNEWLQGWRTTIGAAKDTVGSAYRGESATTKEEAWQGIKDAGKTALETINTATQSLVTSAANGIANTFNLGTTLTGKSPSTVVSNILTKGKEAINKIFGSNKTNATQNIFKNLGEKISNFFNFGKKA